MSDSSKPQPILKVENLSVRREDTQIIRDINWTINQGEHWAILGANGCGKTSLLAAITAYLTPSSGTIQFMDECYGNTDWNEVRHQIGMVSSALARKVPADETALDTVLSGTTAQLGYWTREKVIDSRKALHQLGKMGVRKLAGRNWQILSQGERQKVFIARALMTKPELLILDEPCAGLDPVAREHLLRRLSQLASKGKGPSLVLVTHHIEEIFPEISHVLILNKGKAMASGPKRAVLNSKNLSKAFGANVRVRRDSNDHWKLTVN